MKTNTNNERIERRNKIRVVNFETNLGSGSIIGPKCQEGGEHVVQINSPVIWQ